jgi:UDP-galactose transporter B1
LFCLANAVGQLFIFYILRSFSPIVLVTLTVTRKFFSILVSIVRFGHAVYPWQVRKMFKWMDLPLAE